MVTAWWWREVVVAAKGGGGGGNLWLLPLPPQPHPHPSPPRPGRAAPTTRVASRARWLAVAVVVRVWGHAACRERERVKSDGGFCLASRAVEPRRNAEQREVLKI